MSSDASDDSDTDAIVVPDAAALDSLPPLWERMISSRRILLLHGYTQNASIFRSRIRGLLRKLERGGFDPVFISAPHAATHAGRPIADPRTWWRTTAVSTHEDTPREYIGWAESRAVIVDAWAKGGFLGMLGFSQGAVVVHHTLNELAAARAGDVALQGALAPLLRAPPQFVVCSSGFPSRAGAGDAFYPPRPVHAMRAMITSSDGDALVPPALQDAQAAFFESPARIRHNKGHGVPQTAADCKAIIEFINDAIARP